MKPTRTLALMALFAAGTALAAGKPKPSAVDSNPCAEKGADAQHACSAECFKVDPNKNGQKPNAQEMKCMKACNKKATAVTVKCQTDMEKKKAGTSKKEKNHADEFNLN